MQVGRFEVCRQEYSLIDSPEVDQCRTVRISRQTGVNRHSDALAGFGTCRGRDLDGQLLTGVVKQHPGHTHGPMRQPILPPRIIEQSDAALYLAVALSFVFVLIVFI